MFKYPPIFLENVANGENLQNQRVLNILHFCDTSHPGNVVKDYISAIFNFSRHNIIEINPRLPVNDTDLNWRNFDVILIHYSIYILGENYLPNKISDFIYQFPGLKIQIIQDEYRNIHNMVALMKKLGIHMLISSLVPENIEKVYRNLNSVVAYGALPGAMTEDLVKMKVAPLIERELDIVYRTYTIPHALGKHGQIKTKLANKLPSLLENHGLNLDISDRNESRIYGHDWTKFIYSSKASLGCEGGSSVFDFFGIQKAVNTYQKLHPDATFDEIFDTILQPYDGIIVHKTITPRIFEMIALRTAMILVPGEYRGVIEPWKHYIPLNEDFSNVDEVAEAVQDIVTLQEMVDRCYQEIAQSPKFKWPHFVSQFDHAIDRTLALLEDDPQILSHPYNHKIPSKQLKAKFSPEKLSPRSRPRILLICNIQTKRGASANEQIYAIKGFSKYFVDVVSMLTELPPNVDVERYDIILFHWSVILCKNNWISPQLRERLARARVLKAAFIQDEYRFVDRTKAALRVLGIRLLFTCVPDGEIEKVYPTEELPNLVKVNVMTGCVPEGLPLYPVSDYESRPIDVSYRGRDLPAWLGALAQEKAIIGERFLEDSKHYDLSTDIAWREGDRIYGDDWFQFLADSKATLGVESGASVFDFTGKIQEQVEAAVAADPDISFEALRQRYFAEEEGKIYLNQHSPRIFEAASLKTLLVLYEGQYSGVVEPWKHYVPLKKDHSNMAEVVETIRDVGRAKEIINRAYKEIALNPKYTYRHLVESIDSNLIEQYHAYRKLSE